MPAANGAATHRSAPNVYFFATCVIDMFAPDAGIDAIEVLERGGVTVHVPLRQTCCGQPAYTTGFPEEAARVAAAQLDLFPEPWPIVVPSGSCGGMLKHHWPKLFANDPVRLSQAEGIAARTIEFTDYLLKVAALNWDQALRSPLRVALHTACSARREMGTLDCGRALLQRLPGVELVVQAHESECCGFGGTFSVMHPEISAAMTSDKLDAIRATGCDVMVSADCGCLLSLNLMQEKRRQPLRGRHIASLIRERLDAGTGSRAHASERAGQ